MQGYYSQDSHRPRFFDPHQHNNHTTLQGFHAQLLRSHLTLSKILVILAVTELKAPLCPQRCHLWVFPVHPKVISKERMLLEKTNGPLTVWARTITDISHSLKIHRQDQTMFNYLVDGTKTSLPNFISQTKILCGNSQFSVTVPTDILDSWNHCTNLNSVRSLYICIHDPFYLSELWSN